MAVRYPRCWLAINGAMIPCIKAEVHKNSTGRASTFSAQLSATATAQYGIALADWADFQPTDVQIMMATDGGDPISMITGQIDTPHIDWMQMTIAINGRDKSAGLMERRRSEKFPNQKASDICSTIATANKLNPVISVDADTAGKTYNQDTVHLAIHHTDFEIISDLATKVGARWYVDGTDLHFEPTDQAGDVYSVMWVPPGGAAPYGVATVTDLQTFRNMTAAKPHTINTKSWHDEDGKKYTGSAKADGVGDEIAIDHHHNMRNQSQVDAISMSRLKDAIRHDCNVSIKCPIDLSVSPFMQLQLDGTGTIYDQTYDIDSVMYEISWGSGAEMSIECKAPKSGRSISSGGSDDGADSALGDEGAAA